MKELILFVDQYTRIQMLYERSIFLHETNDGS